MSAAMPNLRSPLGTNMAELADHAMEWVFVDAFKQSRSWISGTDEIWEDGAKLEVDERGWVKKLAPGQIAKTVMFWNEGVRYPSGNYVVLYDGEGSIRYFNNDVVKSSAPGRDVVEVRWEKGGMGLFITKTNPANPLRNIRVLMPGGVCENDGFALCKEDRDCHARACVPFERIYQKQIFHPDFLNSVRGYRTHRFMDWMKVNNSTQVSWSDRPRPEDARYTVKGAPLEVTLELAKRLNGDPWYTLPHSADDDYVRRFAGLVRDGLGPQSIVYVEHSNEVWNSMFSQAEYARRRGLELGLSRDPFEAQLRYHAKRSAEIFRIFTEAFGGSQRLVRVMAGQAANAWASKTLLDYEPAHAVTDALAIAPYFGGYLGEESGQERVTKLTLDELLSELETRAVDEVAGWIREQAETASEHRVRLLAYEGGQHLAGVGRASENAALNKLFDAANRDPRMGRVYRALLGRWREHGGQLFVHYVSSGGYSKWGRWGAIEFLGQARRDAPKFDALQRFIEENPAWW